MAKKKRKDPNAYPVLGTFEGADVIGASLILRNTGDGLSQAMEIEPKVLHVGDVIDVLVRAEVIEIRHRSADDDGAFTRVQVAKAELATIVSGIDIDKLVDEYKQKVEKAAGIERIPFEGDGPAEAPTTVTFTEPTPISDLARKEADRQARMAARREQQERDNAQG